MTAFPIDLVRAQFPALADTTRIHVDNPAGTQVPRGVAEAVADTLLHHNANLGGYFASSQQASAIVRKAHDDAATLFGAASGDEIVIGPSMTALTFQMSRAIGATLSPGDEILVTTMDHDGNVAPWLAMAAERGCTVRRVPFNRDTWRIEPEDLAACLTPRTRVLALSCASNLTGSINDVAALTALAKQAGALVYLDAVQFAPHALLDVAAWGCDFCVASAYKFFGPHLGVLWGRADLLSTLTPQKVRPASDDIPHRWEQGTPQIELQAGLSAAIAYLDWLGAQVLPLPLDPDPSALPPAGGGLRPPAPPTGVPPASQIGIEPICDAGGTPVGVQGAKPPVAEGNAEGSNSTRVETSDAATPRGRLAAAWKAATEWEADAARSLIAGLQSLPGVTIHGITNANRFEFRVPTVSFTHDSVTPAILAERLARAGVFVWSGNNYALEVVRHLGLPEDAGVLRIGLAHYNTPEEVRIVLEEVRKILLF